MGFSVVIGATLISVALIADIFINPTMGTISDKLGIGKMTLIAFVVTFISYFLMAFAGNSVPLAYIGAAINDTMYAYFGLGIALLAVEMFGNKDFSKIYSYISTIGLFVGGFGVTVISGIFDATQKFTVVLYSMAAAIAVCGLLITISLKAAKKLPRE